jgi:hypothetical protein
MGLAFATSVLLQGSRGQGLIKPTIYVQVLCPLEWMKDGLHNTASFFSKVIEN